MLPQPCDEKSEKHFSDILVAGPSHHLHSQSPRDVRGKTALAIAIETARAGAPASRSWMRCTARPSRRSSRSTVVWNRAARGQISSLRRALKQIPVDAAFLIYPVDHPLLKRKTIQQFVRAFRTRRIAGDCHTAAWKSLRHPAIVSGKLRESSSSRRLRAT